MLDATGMRVGALEALAWGDVGEQRGRWRVPAAVAKTGAARWVEPPRVLFDAVTALVRVARARVAAAPLTEAAERPGDGVVRRPGRSLV